MNQNNTIKSLIPRRLLEFVPYSDRDKWANRIVTLVKEHNPALYAEMGNWHSIPEDELERVKQEICSAVAIIQRAC